MYEYIKNFMGMDPYDYFCGMPAVEDEKEEKEEDKEEEP